MTNIQNLKAILSLIFINAFSAAILFGYWHNASAHPQHGLHHLTNLLSN